MTRQEHSELFELLTLGAAASAFLHSGVSPDEYWPFLRGEKEMTLRTLGEIGHVTGAAFSLKFYPADEPEKDVGQEGASE